MSTMKQPSPALSAAVRSGVLLSLMEALPAVDSTFPSALPPGRYAAVLAAPGGIRRRYAPGGGTRGALLFFPRAEDMARVLAGEKGRVLPLPTGRGFFKALKAFRSAAARVKEEMAALPGEEDLPGREKKTRLLLTAALRGVCEVYEADPWTRVKARRIPPGTIAVSVGGRPELGALLKVEPGRMTPDFHADRAGANAVLEFQDPSVCFRILTGELPALGALGDGRLSLRGRIPMIQGLFPLLDRFGEIMQ